MPPRADEPGDEPVVADDDGPVHRRLIRATLPRPEGHVPERKEPEFTIRQQGGRGGGAQGSGRQQRRLPAEGPGAAARRRVRARRRRRWRAVAVRRSAARIGPATSGTAAGADRTTRSAADAPTVWARGPAAWSRFRAAPRRTLTRRVRLLLHSDMNDFTGKCGLIVGVANKYSIAWAIAQATARRGARLALTYQGRFEDHVKKLAGELPERAAGAAVRRHVGRRDQGRLRARWTRNSAASTSCCTARRSRRPPSSTATFSTPRATASAPRSTSPPTRSSRSRAARRR